MEVISHCLGIGKCLGIGLWLGLGIGLFLWFFLILRIGVGENFLNVDNISWACDDKDPAKAVLTLFNWDKASIIKA